MYGGMFPVMPWASTGSDGRPYFTGNNATTFTEEFEEFCSAFRHPKAQWKTSSVRFMAKKEQERVKCFEGYNTMDWEKFKTKLKKEYRARDEEQQMLTPGYLEALARQPRTRKSDIQLYLQQFNKCAKHLLAKRTQSEFMCCRLFVEGLPEYYREKIIMKQKLDDDAPETARYGDCYDQAVSIWEREDRTANFYTKGVGGLDYDKLVRSKEAIPSAARNKERTDRIRAIEPSRQEVAEEAESLKDEPVPKTKEITVEELTERMGAMILRLEKGERVESETSVMELKALTESVSAIKKQLAGLLPTPQGLSNARGPDGRGQRGEWQGQGGQSRRNSMNNFQAMMTLLCFFCKGTHLLRDCPHFRVWKDKGYIHYNGQNRKFYLGPYRQNRVTPALEPPENMSQEEIVSWYDIKIREAGLTPQWSEPNPNDELDQSKFQGVRALRAGAIINDEACLDSEEEEEAHLSAVRNYHAEGEVFLDPIKRPATDQGQRARVKQPRTGTYQPPSSSNMATRQSRPNGEIIYDGTGGDNSDEILEVRQPRTRSQPLDTVQSREQTSQDTVMPDAPARRPRARGEPVALHEGSNMREKLQKVLSKTNTSAKLVDRALDAEVPNVKIREMLETSKDFRDEWFSRKAWYYDQQTDQVMHHLDKKQPAPRGSAAQNKKNAPAPVTLAAHQASVSVQNEYFRRSPYILVKTVTGQERALVDTGAEINVMSRDLMEEMGLQSEVVPTKYISNAISFEGSAGANFLGMIENLLIQAGGVEAVTHVYIASTMDPAYRLILGMPFQQASNCGVYHKPDKSCVVQVTDYRTGDQVNILAVDAEEEDDEKMQEMRDLAHLRPVKE